MLDSPMLSGWKARAVRAAKAAGIGERFSPGHVSKRRRQHGPSAAAAFEHFAAKPACARWAPGVLRYDMACGIERHGSAHRLSFDRTVKTAIYNALPHQLARMLRAHALRCPMAFVRGTETQEIRQVGMAATTRLAHGRVSRISGSHLCPFEHPLATATEVPRRISAMNSLPPAAGAR